MEHIRESLKDLKDLIESNLINEEDHIEITPKELMDYFGSERRTKNNVAEIRQFLGKQEVKTVPDFETTYIHKRIQLKKIPKAHVKSSDGTGDQINFDPVARLEMLDAANRKPISISKNKKLQEATTILMMNDFSQIPVMDSDRQINGLISWQSIGPKIIQDGDLLEGKVKDFINKEYQIMEAKTPLIEAVREVIRNEVVFVRQKDNTVCGPITSTDIGEQFFNLSEPFLILQEIENHIRNLLAGKFTITKIRDFANSTYDDNRTIESLSDLTFGEYIRIMENKENWENLQLNIDRNEFIKGLEEIRRIRNDVMHFHPDGISKEDLDKLKKTSKFFLQLSSQIE